MASKCTQILTWSDVRTPWERGWESLGSEVNLGGLFFSWFLLDLLSRPNICLFGNVATYRLTNIVLVVTSKTYCYDSFENIVQETMHNCTCQAVFCFMAEWGNIVWQANLMFCKWYISVCKELMKNSFLSLVIGRWNKGKANSHVDIPMPSCTKSLRSSSRLLSYKLTRPSPTLMWRLITVKAKFSPPQINPLSVDPPLY